MILTMFSRERESLEKKNKIKIHFLPKLDSINDWDRDLFLCSTALAGHYQVVKLAEWNIVGVGGVGM